MPASLKAEDAAKTKSGKEPSQEPFAALAKPEDLDVDSRLQDPDTVTLTMVTRGTSPSPPASSSFVRSRRADMGIAHQKEITRGRRKAESKDQEAQCDRLEDTSRFSRFGGGGRISGSPWSSYLDKFSSSNPSGTPVYGRGFNGNGNATNSRVNSFAFTRTNDSSIPSRNDATSKVSPSSSQEIHGNRNQNEQNAKVFGGLGYQRGSADPSIAKTDSASNMPTSTGQGNSSRDQADAKVQSGETRSCPTGKGEAKSDRFGSPKTFNGDSSGLKREGSPQHSAIVAKSHNSRESSSRSEEAHSGKESSTSKSEGCNQRRPSIPRLGRASTKNEVKIMKSSSGTSSKSDGLRERRSSTPKSDASSLSRLDEPARIVEGYCHEQGEDIAPSKRDNTSSGREPHQRYISRSIEFSI